MKTLKEKITAAFEIKELALKFGLQYFAEYSFLCQLGGNKRKLNPSYFEDDVEIDYIDEEGDSLTLKLSYETGSYGCYETHNEYVHVPVEILEEFLINPNAAENLAFANSEHHRKKIEEQNRLELEKKLKEEEHAKNKKYQQYLKLKQEFENQ